MRNRMAILFQTSLYRPSRTSLYNINMTYTEILIEVTNLNHLRQFNDKMRYKNKMGMFQ